jgi:hypothetical protein
MDKIHFLEISKLLFEKVLTFCFRHKSIHSKGKEGMGNSFSLS